MIKDNYCTTVQVSPEKIGINNTTMMSIHLNANNPKKKFSIFNFQFSIFSFLIAYCLLPLFSFAQSVEVVAKPYIQCIRFHENGNQFTLPIYTLNSGSQLELHFDDMETNYKNYYYTLQLCDYNWNKVGMSPFNYLKGFTQQRITNYRYSSITFTKYTHYQTTLPDRNMMPTLSGNYLLKVFLDGDTNKLVFTRKMLVVENKANIVPQLVQPLNSYTFRTHQKLVFNAKIEGLNAFSPMQQTKVVILQNNRWDNAQKDIVPTFVRGNVLEYNTENSAIFPAGKEWRWLDLRSFRFQSDRVDTATYTKTTTEVFVKTDIDRSSQRYVYYRDFNGMFSVESYENINPYWQADYATVHFSFLPPDGNEYKNKDLYLIGQLTNYELNDKTRMVYNAEKKLYETSCYLKQGYYSYSYLLVDKNNPNDKMQLEGDYWETENTYTILLYYKGFADRSDQLIGMAQIRSRLDRPGVSF
jgi:hypothetical protein